MAAPTNHLNRKDDRLTRNVLEEKYTFGPIRCVGFHRSIRLVDGQHKRGLLRRRMGSRRSSSGYADAGCLGGWHAPHRKIQVELCCDRLLRPVHGLDVYLAALGAEPGGGVAWSRTNTS